jgi:ADP-heptose:LPS heptosyltransferase
MEWADKFLAINSILSNDILVVIHPGASEPTKMWQGQNFAELIQRLSADSQTKILIIEGNQDREIFDEILRLTNKNKVVHFKSNSIIKTAALIKRCKLFITHDTGTRHLAVAVGTPVLVLLPEDNLKSWNFYEGIDFHYAIIGKRHFPSPGSSERAFLGDISVEDVCRKVGEILGSWHRMK